MCPAELSIDKHGVHITAPFDRATLALDSKPPTNTFKRVPVEDDRSTDLYSIERNTEKEPIEYAVDQTVSHECSDDDLCYRVC